MRVYVAAPWGRAYEASHAHGLLVALGLTPTSSWVSEAARSSGDGSLDDRSARLAIVQNDEDVANSDALLVLSYPSEGGEMFAEARLALQLGKPVVWVRGRQILSAWREGVTVVEHVTEAMLVLRKLDESRCLS